MLKKILLIDDDPSVHFIVSPILSKEGYDVVSAKHGEHGLHLALNERPDLIIMDVIMPGIKGRELCLKMKSYDVLKNIPVIFLTAKDSEDDIKAELDAGAITHLSKPIDSAQLVTVIKSILGS